MQFARRFLVLAALCFALGGFTFYAAVVVPIGSQVLDATAQGFVTQRVTHAINASVGVTVLLVGWEAFATRRQRPRGQQRVLIASLLLAAVCCLALALLHGKLDELLDPREFTVRDPARFYRLHQVYLWISSLQWLALLATLGLLACPPGSPPRRAS